MSTKNLSDEASRYLSDIEEFSKTLLSADGEKVNSNWHDNWKACGEAGLLALAMPTEYGGKGFDVVSSVAALEAFGYGFPDNAIGIGINGQIWAVQIPVLTFGTEEQKKRYLPGMCDGSIVSVHALTEAETGSDAMSLKTTAKREDGGYVLRGRKVLIGLGPACDMALVFASTAPEKGQWGVSAFLVENGDKGFERGEALDKLGLDGTPFGELRFNDCWIPEDRRLGSEGAGMSIFNHTLEWERCFILTCQVGAMQRQLEECVKFARSRETFGKKIIENQSVSNRLADMKLRHETSKLLLYKVAELKDQNRSAAMEAAMANLQISESFLASSIDAMRIMGGKGFLSGNNAEMDFRDSMGGVIYSGTSDIQRQIISRLL